MARRWSGKLQKLIIIAGCPATGKKTLGMNLSGRIVIPFLEYNSFLLGMGAARMVEGEIVIDEDKAEAAFDNLNGTYIISGTYALRLVNLDQVKSVIVLRCNPFVLFYRYLMRNYDLKKIRDNLTAEFVDSCLTDAIKAVGEEKVMQVDGTFDTPSSLSARVEFAMRNNISIFETINWLSYIHNHKQLNMFMS